MNKGLFITEINNVVDEGMTQKIDEVFKEYSLMTYSKRLRLIKWSLETNLIFNEMIPLGNYWEQIASVYFSLESSQKNLVLSAIREKKVINKKELDAILKILKEEAKKFKVNFPLRVNRILPKNIMDRLTIENRKLPDWLGIGIANFIKSDYTYYFLENEQLHKCNYNFSNDVSEYLKNTLKFHINEFKVNFAIDEILKNKEMRLLYDLLYIGRLNLNDLSMLLNYKVIQKLMINVGLKRKLSSNELDILKGKVNYTFRFYGPEFADFLKKYSIRVSSNTDYIDGVRMVDVSEIGPQQWKFKSLRKMEISFLEVSENESLIKKDNYRKLLVQHLNDKTVSVHDKIKVINVFLKNNKLTYFNDAVKEYLANNLEEEQILALAIKVIVNNNYERFSYADADLVKKLIDCGEKKATLVLKKILSIDYTKLPFNHELISNKYVDFTSFLNCDLGRYFEVLKENLEGNMDDNLFRHKMSGLKRVNKAYRDFIIGRLWKFLKELRGTISINTLLGYSTTFYGFNEKDLSIFSDVAIDLLQSDYESRDQNPYIAFNLSILLSRNVKPCRNIPQTKLSLDVLKNILGFFVFSKRKYSGSWIEKYSEIPQFPEICVSTISKEFFKIKGAKLQKIITYIERASSTKKGIVDISMLYIIHPERLDSDHYEKLLQLIQVLIAKRYIDYSIMMSYDLDRLTKNLDDIKKQKLIKLFKEILTDDEYENLLK
ncbi:hypothetical protein [Limosilactobacillus albertensis]|uniref:Uncharacterized protein n=1 Tax=Limosilactobacillus albertensis TaxID=2759752 RepID=A0A839H6W5_9LACO|nr:hypothetical protein [Limosilactobacillus albertensis]MBB1122846.1 hypothetical protein [Limosilactobacillus albertensis]MCD7122528.1 hypothetical protein [Limosilactobacillus albertensis]